MLRLADGCRVLTSVGQALDRPESVLATADGNVYASHRGHGVVRIAPDGRQFLMGTAAAHGGLPLLPNGIALLPDATFLIANISDAGGLFRLSPGGRAEPWITEIDGRRCPPVNFVTTDAEGRVWFSVSSTLSPRHLSYRRDVANGFVAMVDKGRARIVLDGLHYTNEVVPDLDSGMLWVSETFGQKVSRFALDSGATVGARTGTVRFPRGAFVDGIAFDEEGGLWAACIVSNEVFRLPPGGQEPLLVAGERDASWVDAVEAALDTGRMDRSHFDRAPTAILRNVSSLAFAGPDRATLLCGSLLGDSLPALAVPHRGRQPHHWNVRVPDAGEFMGSGALSAETPRPSAAR